MNPSFPNASQDFIKANPNLYGNKTDPELPDAEQCKQATALGFENERKALRSARPIVGFTLFRVRKLDWEAKYSSVKDLLDALQYAGAIRGDREEDLDPKSYVNQIKVDHYSEEKTEIVLIYPE